MSVSSSVINWNMNVANIESDDGVGMFCDLEIKEALELGVSNTGFGSSGLCSNASTTGLWGAPFPSF